MSEQTQLITGRIEGALSILKQGGDFNREGLIEIMEETVAALAEMPSFGTIREYTKAAEKRRGGASGVVQRLFRVDGTLYVELERDGSSYWEDPDLIVVDLPTFVRDWEVEG